MIVCHLAKSRDSSIVHHRERMQEVRATSVGNDHRFPENQPKYAKAVDNVSAERERVRIGDHSLRSGQNPTELPPVTPDWNGLLRQYRPRKEILDRS